MDERSRYRDYSLVQYEVGVSLGVGVADGVLCGKWSGSISTKVRKCAAMRDSQLLFDNRSSSDVKWVWCGVSLFFTWISYGVYGVEESTNLLFLLSHFSNVKSRVVGWLGGF